ncbi:MAG: hypothetical protein CMG41_01485 [Candidatus Marinimicrobia bacterium]|nr:hypothetical protein [Candidatus Neomarinimicrobiota bacterium]|tara:strand:+ start:251 stop:1318 length:1068 start_codon:yes stop_codon:yes gene_type:complete
MNLTIYILTITISIASFLAAEIKTKTIKTYSISRNFGTETRELTQSTFVRYNSKKQIIDSTLYIHNIPLSEKYSYMNFNDRKSLQKLGGVERLMHFTYEYNLGGQLISKFLYGNNNDSLKWREFYKYYSNGKLWKVIRFDPSKVNSENKIDGQLSDPNNMPWGETFSYNDSGNIKEHKEFYAGFIIESTTYDTDTSGAIIIKEENYDPSIMRKTTYSYNDSGLLNEIINSRRGFSIGSEIHTFDKARRKNKIDYYNLNGILEKTSTYLYEINGNRETKIITDASKKLILRIESRKNSSGKKIIEATFDGKSRLIQKKTIGYDENGNLSRVHDYDMLKPGENGNPILINIITYDYD